MNPRRKQFHDEDEITTVGDNDDRPFSDDGYEDEESGYFGAEDEFFDEYPDEDDEDEEEYED